MAGRITHSDEQLRPDARYNDILISKFINCIMSDGKKSVAQRVMYDAMDLIDQKLAKIDDPDKPDNAQQVFHMAIDKLKPFVEVRSKRVGGANYQVPMQVKPRRQQSLAFRWCLAAARGEKGRPIAERLADEILSAARGEGKAMATREQVHRMAEANRAFAHFAH
ncbi:MAG: 30S ribosomal protein S7 [Phycisphaerales bacterium]